MDRYEFEMLVEMSGVPRATVVAQAVLAKMLDGTKFVSKVPHNDAWVYRFSHRNGKQLLIAWARDTMPSPVSLRLPANWHAYDLMGNKLGVHSGLQIDSVPVYLFSP